MAWVLLGLAAICEIVFAIAMKQAEGFTKLVPSLVVVVAGAGGVALLTLALKTLPVSIGYPMWTGAGIIGTVVLGALMLGEPITPPKVIGAVLLISGIVTLYAANAEG